MTFSNLNKISGDIGIVNGHEATDSIYRESNPLRIESRLISIQYWILNLKFSFSSMSEIVSPVTRTINFSEQEPITY